MFSGKYQLKHVTGFLVVMVIIGLLAAAITSPVAADSGGLPPDPPVIDDSLPISGGEFAANPQDTPTESQIIYDLAAFLITAGI